MLHTKGTRPASSNETGSLPRKITWPTSGRANRGKGWLFGFSEWSTRCDSLLAVRSFVARTIRLLALQCKQMYDMFLSESMHKKLVTVRAKIFRWFRPFTRKETETPGTRAELQEKQSDRFNDGSLSYSVLHSDLHLQIEITHILTVVFWATWRMQWM